MNKSDKLHWARLAYEMALDAAMTEYLDQVASLVPDDGWGDVDQVRRAVRAVLRRTMRASGPVTRTELHGAVAGRDRQYLTLALGHLERAGLIRRVDAPAKPGHRAPETWETDR